MRFRGTVAMKPRSNGGEVEGIIRRVYSTPMKNKREAKKTHGVLVFGFDAVNWVLLVAGSDGLSISEGELNDGVSEVALVKFCRDLSILMKRETEENGGQFNAEKR
nr:hypothetical protein Iba_chr03dCG0870 [Ipomoea batatas]